MFITTTYVLSCFSFLFRKTMHPAKLKIIREGNFVFITSKLFDYLMTVPNTFDVINSIDKSKWS